MFKPLLESYRAQARALLLTASFFWGQEMFGRGSVGVASQASQVARLLVTLDPSGVDGHNP